MAVVAKKIEAHGDSAPREADWMYSWRLDSAINIVDSGRCTLLKWQLGPKSCFVTTVQPS